MPPEWHKKSWVDAEANPGPFAVAMVIIGGTVGEHRTVKVRRVHHVMEPLNAAVTLAKVFDGVWRGCRDHVQGFPKSRRRPKGREARWSVVHLEQISQRSKEPCNAILVMVDKGKVPSKAVPPLKTSHTSLSKHFKHVHATMHAPPTVTLALPILAPDPDPTTSVLR